MFPTITTEERKDLGVTGLADTPQLSPKELQERFDSLGNLSLDKLSELLDMLNGNSAANQIHLSNGNSLQDEYYNYVADLKNLKKSIEKKYNVNSISRNSNILRITVDDTEWVDISEKLKGFTEYCIGTTFVNYTVTQQASFSENDQIGVRVLDSHGEIIGENSVIVGYIGSDQGEAACTLSFSIYLQEENECTVQVFLTNTGTIDVSCSITTLKEGD